MDWRRLLFLWTVILCPSQVIAQEHPRAVAVLAAASAEDLERALAERVEARAGRVLAGDALRARVRAHSEPAPSSAVLGLFAPATAQIARGVERFFYMSPAGALPDLEPVVLLAERHPAVLAYRPDLAEQIWQAGILVVRAHAEVSGADRARESARTLVALFPTRELDPKVVPPATRELFESVRGALRQRGRELRLIAPEGLPCQISLNGMAAVAGKPYVVEREGTYFAKNDCGHSSAPPVWRLPRVVAKEGPDDFLVAPVPLEDFTLDWKDDRGRSTAEWHLRAFGRLVSAGEVIGIARDGETVRVARVRESGDASWGQGEGPDAVGRALAQVDPGANAEPAAELVAVSAPGRRVDWLAIGLVSGGVVSGGAGTYLLVAAGRQARLLDCAVNNPAPPAGRDCAGLPEGIYFRDFARQTRQVGAARAGGAVLIGAGALAVGFGVWRLLAGRDDTSSRVGVSMNGLEVVW